MTSQHSSATPTIRIRRSADRGFADHAWLRTHHSFSFADYQDPAHQQFRSLRVINEDYIAPGRGFPMHPHRSMEILTYLVSGELRHEDSLGNARTIQPGEIQYMSAGSGVLHSEFNPSDTTPTHLLQIWILPDQSGGEPRYRDLDLRDSPTGSPARLIAAPEANNPNQQVIALRQNAEIHSARLTENQSLTLTAPEARPHTWLQLITGTLELNGHQLHAGDAAAIPPELSDHLKITSQSDSHFLLFHLS